MHLREALGGVDEVDPTRPLEIGPRILGQEAAAVAAAILAGDEVPLPASAIARDFKRPVYWYVDHTSEGSAEIFGFPLDWQVELPTAIEIAIVRAISYLPPEQHDAIFSGGTEIIIGSEKACVDFRKAALAAENLSVDEISELYNSSNVVISPKDGRGSQVALACLLSSYDTSPLKFRFLELYRVMEALFIADVKTRLIADFDAEPVSALNDAISALQSELNQIISLAEPHKELFEDCWNQLDAIKSINRFAAALFKRLEKKKVNGQGKWQTGAALIYQIRCAIVHAGERDMIFENFPDGDLALKKIMPILEQAALRMIGFTLS